MIAVNIIYSFKICRYRKRLLIGDTFKLGISVLSDIINTRNSMNCDFLSFNGTLKH